MTRRTRTMLRARSVMAAMGAAAMAVVAIAVAGGSGVHAQQPPPQEAEVVADVDRTELAVGERLTLTVTVTGGPLNPRQPELQAIGGLRRAGPPSTQFFRRTINGSAITSEASFQYPFVATREGTVTIPPIEVVIGGRVYSTEEIQVRVYRGLGTGGGTPGPGDSPSQGEVQGNERTPAMFVTASVDDERPYLGEQITYTFRFYRRSALRSFGQYGRPQYQPPDFSGFWNIRETDQTEYTDTIGFDRYTVAELQTVLFPSVVGTTTIEPAGLSVPIDFFAAPNHLETDPIRVEVRPLPTDAPAGFTGAVGRFDITSQVDDSVEGKVNEPVQLTVSISGEGNIETLPDPAWPEFENWRMFESPASDRSGVIDGRLVGERDYEVILVPQRAGELEIPRITYPFFDTETGEYTTAVTDPISMTIAEADGVPALASGADGAAGVERAGSDVRHIKAAPSSLGQSGGGFVGGAVYWAAWGVPLLALVLAVAWSRRRTRYDEAADRRRNALPEARAAIALAQQSEAAAPVLPASSTENPVLPASSTENPVLPASSTEESASMDLPAHSTDDPAAAMADILLTYLSARLGAPMGGLTHEALAQRLLEAGVDSDLAGRVEDVLSIGEVAKYGRTSSDSAEFGEYYEMVGRLLDELDGAISE